MANILAVDDNLELCKLIRTALERDGHRVETRLSGAELDRTTLPLGGLHPAGCDDARGGWLCGLPPHPRPDRCPHSVSDAPAPTRRAVLEGLGIGADDFLSKPFRVAELRARVAAHLRRQNRTPVHRMVRGGVSF